MLTSPAQAATDTPDRITVPSSSSVVKHLKKYPSGRYIVTLKDDPAATYAGGISGYAATKAAAGTQLDASSATVKKYRGYLKDKQKSLLSKVGAKALYSYTTALNGFAANLSSTEAARLAASSSVKAVTPNTLLKVQAEKSTAYLGLEGKNGVWSKLGGVTKAGKGVVVGVLDTGIAPENPSFAGSKLSTKTSSSTPYLSGSTVVYKKSDGKTFHSTEVTGEQWDASDYSTKIIGGHYYVDGFGQSNIGDASMGEYLSPRDGDGHGSHTSSTAAGNNGVAASVEGRDFGTISGVAPAAKISMYKVCWTGNDPTVTTDDGCATSDIVAAVDQAVTDGVDVINFSIGGGSATTVFSPSDQAFLNAAAAGVFVSAAGGNDGPGASTLDNAAPWETTVAASTIPDYEGTVELGNGQKYAGASLTVTAPVSGALTLAEANPAAGVDPTDANLCAPNSLGAAVAGTVVVCDRGVYDRVAKSAEVARAGGIGMVLVNVPGNADDVDNDFHSVPTVHIHSSAHDAIRAYAATAGATVTLVPDNVTSTQTPVPQIAGFSSHGPVLAAGSDVLKPDIAAPGVSILAATGNPQGGTPTYAFESGTSMATPHVAGLAALYFGVHPKASPMEIKSALMTTATNTVGEDGADTTDPFAQGAGEVHPASYLDPGLLYLAGVKDWLRYLVGTGDIAGSKKLTAIDGSDLNQASIAIGDFTGTQKVTRTVTAASSGAYRASVSVAGVKATVSPSTIVLRKGQSKTFTVTFTRTSAALDKWTSGFLTWKKVGSSTTVRSPIAIHPTTVSAPESVAGTGTTGSTKVTVTPGISGDIPIDAQGLAQGLVTPNETDPTAPYTDIATQGGSAAYVHHVLAGTTFARFDVTPDTEAGADLDLYVLYSATYSDNLDDYALVAQSATGSAGESVQLTDPDAGYYVTFVDYYSTPAAGVPYKDVAFLLNPATDVGSLTATPSTIHGTAGKPTSYELSWSGLDAGATFLGFVHYGDAESVTDVTVTT